MIGTAYTNSYKTNIKIKHMSKILNESVMFRKVVCLLRHKRNTKCQFTFTIIIQF